MPDSNNTEKRGAIVKAPTTSLQKTSSGLVRRAIQDIERLKKKVEIVIGDVNDEIIDLIADCAREAMKGRCDINVSSFKYGEDMLEYTRSGAGDIFIIYLNNIMLRSARSFEERMENALQLVTHIKTTLGKPVIVLSSTRYESYSIRGKLAADFFFQMPFKYIALIASIQKCLNMLPGFEKSLGGGA